MSGGTLLLESQSGPDHLTSNPLGGDDALPQLEQQRKPLPGWFRGGRWATLDEPWVVRGVNVLLVGPITAALGWGLYDTFVRGAVVFVLWNIAVLGLGCWATPVAFAALRRAVRATRRGRWRGWRVRGAPRRRSSARCPQRRWSRLSGGARPRAASPCSGAPFLPCP